MTMMPRRHTPFPRNLHPSAYGGVLRNRARGRGARSVSTKYSMHLVLRSSQAKGSWSFVRSGTRHMINSVLAKHARRTGVLLMGTGNAGNHLHIRVRFSSRVQYKCFIRAITGEIALKIEKISRTIGGGVSALTNKKGFWDRRPFSSIVSDALYAARLADYIKINQLEGRGYTRAFARLIVKKWRDGT